MEQQRLQHQRYITIPALTHDDIGYSMWFVCFCCPDHLRYLSGRVRRGRLLSMRTPQKRRLWGRKMLGGPQARCLGKRLRKPATRPRLNLLLLLRRRVSRTPAPGAGLWMSAWVSSPSCQGRNVGDVDGIGLLGDATKGPATTKGWKPIQVAQVSGILLICMALLAACVRHPLVQMYSFMCTAVHAGVLSFCAGSQHHHQAFGASQCGAVLLAPPCCRQGGGEQAAQRAPFGSSAPGDGKGDGEGCAARGRERAARQEHPADRRRDPGHPRPHVRPSHGLPH